MKKRWYLFVMLFVCQVGFAQVTSEKVFVQSVKKINFLYPGFEKEKPLSAKTTWGYSLGTRFWYSAGLYYDEDYSRRWKFDYVNLVPSGVIYGRWYYNIAKRERKHKKIGNNSASYFTAGAAVYLDGINLVGEGNPEGDHIFTGLYAGWGMRRTFGRRIIFDMHLKIQPTMQDNTDFDVLFIPGIHLGYLLNK